MNILYVFQLDYPWDIRVEKITRSLRSRGSDVHVVANNGKGWARRERLDGIEIHRLPGFSTGVGKALNIPAFFSPLWLGVINRVVDRHGIDLLIVRDLPLAPAGIIISRARKIPVIIDLAEDYPEMIRSTWRHRGVKVQDLLIRNPYLLKGLERVTLPRADHVVVVSDLSGERVARLGVKKENITVIGNTPAVPDKVTLNRQIRELSGFNLLYVGGLEEARGIANVIKALPRVRERIKDFRFIIVGEGASQEQLRRLAKGLGVEDVVHFAGYLPNHQIYQVIRASDVGLIPHHADPHTNTTLPNKLFDYMSQGIPVIATRTDALRLVLDETGCGVTFRDGDLDEMGQAILLFQDRKQRTVFGRRGRRAFLEKYNWSVEEEKLWELIASVGRRPRLLPSMHGNPPL